MVKNPRSKLNYNHRLEKNYFSNLKKHKKQKTTQN